MLKLWNLFTSDVASAKDILLVLCLCFVLYVSSAGDQCYRRYTPVPFPLKQQKKHGLW